MAKIRKEKRAARISRISHMLLKRFEKHYETHEKHKKRKPLRAKERSKAKLKYMVAYDLETTNIAAGTPELKYITAFSEEIGLELSAPVRSLNHLRDIVERHFLDPEFSGYRFVAWNANNFDVYFIAACLLHSPEYILRPYLTKGKKVRGLKVILRENEKVSWEFLDGMSMTGIQKPLKNFLQVFAPEFGKLESPAFNDGEEFDPNNKDHVAYAMRDSVGLYHGMIAAEQIVVKHFNIGLQPTIGNMGIKIFQSFIPLEISVWALPMPVEKIVRDHVMRGGYCHCVKRYYGPVWKYDINQAYAAAMREAWLPAGSVVHTDKVHPAAKCAIYLVDAVHRKNIVPFYWKNLEQESLFSIDRLENAWITSIEYEQLKREGWRMTIKDGYFWNDYFKMKKYVDRLEELRNSGEGGSKGAQGEMVKAIGNNSYGKTVEQLEGLELILSRECPTGYAQYQDDDELFQHIWFKFNDPGLREYHQPHIGAFITAQVRMVLRRAIMLNPEAWLYADTDGIMFSEPVDLDISPTIYGKWKIEAEGEMYRLITKKVYANNDASEKHAKGVNINRLTNQDFIDWFEGKPPVQTQVQRANFLEAMTGGNMFFERTKVGQKV